MFKLFGHFVYLFWCDKVRFWMCLSWFWYVKSWFQLCLSWFWCVKSLFKMSLSLLIRLMSGFMLLWQCVCDTILVCLGQWDKLDVDGEKHINLVDACSTNT